MCIRDSFKLGPVTSVADGGPLLVLIVLALIRVCVAVGSLLHSEICLLYTSTVSQMSKDRVMKALEEIMRPEFLNRIDEIIAFNQLSEDKDVYKRQAQDRPRRCLRAAVGCCFVRSCYYTQAFWPLIIEN